MISEAPPFWWSEKGWQGLALSPAGWAYGRVARWRMERGAAHADGCAGHLRGKPDGRRCRQDATALALGVRALRRGLKPGFLSRGHGGSAEGPTLVDPHRHGAGEVGDEPLLLARCATTVVARDRIAGARQLLVGRRRHHHHGRRLPERASPFRLCAPRRRRPPGPGQRRLIPAGPVRAPVVDQLRHASALVRIGEGEAADWVVRLAARAAKPIQRARLAPCNAGDLAGRPVLAFAAIGDPEKFFATVQAVGAALRLSRAFPDHHVFSDEEAAELLRTAQEQGLTLVTTAKDMVRLEGAHGQPAELARLAKVIEVELVFSEQSVPDQIIDAATDAFRKRRRA